MILWIRNELIWQARIRGLSTMYALERGRDETIAVAEIERR